MHCCVSNTYNTTAANREVGDIYSSSKQQFDMRSTSAATLYHTVSRIQCSSYHDREQT